MSKPASSKSLPSSVPTRAGKSGMPPGAVVHVGSPKSNKSVINVVVYSSSEIVEKIDTNLPEAIALVHSNYNTPEKFAWINIDGLGNLEVLKELGSAFSIHPLVLEDISNPNQRPRVEHYETFTFIVLRSYLITVKKRIESEQVSLILGQNFLITIQEKSGDAFIKISERLQHPESRLRSGTPDYLAYSVLDSVVDGYFSVLEQLGGVLESLENEIVEKPSEKSLKSLYINKRFALELRRSIWPVRELLSNLDRSDSRFILPTTKLYLRDVYSHIVEAIDTLEIYREMLSGLLDVYLSSQSNRLNEVMKVLTVITTIFMPLSLITGIYGMNFEFMPELKSSYGYPAVMILIVAIAVTMYAYFKRKGWV